MPFDKKTALALRKKHPDYNVITGSTDIALRVTKNNELLPEIIDLSQVKDMCFTKENESSFVFGSNLSLEEQEKVLKEFQTEFKLACQFVYSMTGEKNLLWFTPWLKDSINLRSSMIQQLYYRRIIPR